jgi:hypothetical protein
VYSACRLLHEKKNNNPSILELFLSPIHFSYLFFVLMVLYFCVLLSQIIDRLSEIAEPA